jgi:hypothetical protein
MSEVTERLEELAHQCVALADQVDLATAEELLKISYRLLQLADPHALPLQTVEKC